MNIWPVENETEMINFYGIPGSDIVQLKLPYPMRLAWDLNTTVKKIACHNKVQDSLLICLENILLLYKTPEKIKEMRMDLFGGCFNIRKQRGGTSLSIHSWGAAIDLDPEHNQLKWKRSQASMPEEVIDIFENEGWVSLGRQKDYDYMHFQAAQLK